MNDILEMIEDLETLDALDTVSKEAHLELLISKYHKKVDDYEREMESQMGFDFHA